MNVERSCCFLGVYFSIFVIFPIFGSTQYIVMHTSVCLSVCLLAYLKNHTTKLQQFLCKLLLAMAWSASGGVVLM